MHCTKGYLVASPPHATPLDTYSAAPRGIIKRLPETRPLVNSHESIYFILSAN